MTNDNSDKRDPLGGLLQAMAWPELSAGWQNRLMRRIDALEQAPPLALFPFSRGAQATSWRTSVLGLTLAAGFIAGLLTSHTQLSSYNSSLYSGSGMALTQLFMDEDRNE